MNLYSKIFSAPPTYVPIGVQYFSFVSGAVYAKTPASIKVKFGRQNYISFHVLII